MINEMKVNNDVERKEIDIDEFVKRLIQIFHNYKVMFIYYGGSLAYNTYTKGRSDIDLEVFIDGIPYPYKSDLSDIDLFVYPKEYITKRFDMDDEELNSYRKSFADVYLGLPDTLVYLNDEYKEDYLKYKDFDFKKIIPDFLREFIDYYGFCLEGTNLLGKKFYHIIRMRGQLENYLKTGVYSFEVPDKYKEELLDFKINFQNEDKNKYYLKKINTYFDEIKEIREKLING